MDIKTTTINGFKLISLTDKEYFVRDIEESNNGVWNGFMVAKTRNQLLHKAINKVVENVKKEYYGKSTLEPTGPLMLKDIIHETNLTSKLINDTFYVFNDGIPIFENNKQAQYSYSYLKHYAELYTNRQVYKSFVKIES